MIFNAISDRHFLIISLQINFLSKDEGDILEKEASVTTCKKSDASFIKRKGGKGAFNIKTRQNFLIFVTINITMVNIAIITS